MRRYFLLILLLTSYSYSQELCLECSQNIGSSFMYAAPSVSDGNSLLSSAVGMISSEISIGADGSKLISGYMPVCVLPIVTSESDIRNCSDEQFELYAGSYLSNEIIWTFEDVETITEFPYKRTEAPFNFSKSNVNAKKQSYTVQVRAKKGKIQSEENTLTVTVFPKPIIEVKGDTNSYCRGAIINFSALDKTNPDNIEGNFNWSYDFGSGRSTFRGKDLSINTPAMESEISVDLIVNNEYTDSISCAVDTINFTLKSINPESNTDIVLSEVGRINPSEYENKTLKILVKLNGLVDYNSGLAACPPSTFSADLVINNKHFLPLVNNIPEIILLQGTPTINETTIKFRSLGIKNIGQNELFEIEGYPLLGESLTSSIYVSNIILEDNSISDSTYKVNGSNVNLEFITCNKGEGSRLLFTKAASPIIYPNPNNGSVVNVNFNIEDSLSIKSIKIKDFYGNTLFVLQNIEINEKTSTLNLSEELSIGIYMVEINTDDRVYNLMLNVVR